MVTSDWQHGAVTKKGTTQLCCGITATIFHMHWMEPQLAICANGYALSNFTFKESSSTGGAQTYRHE
jgi:hypothetical protein